jgi:hypothetical protein
MLNCTYVMFESTSGFFCAARMSLEVGGAVPITGVGVHGPALVPGEADVCVGCCLGGGAQLAFGFFSAPGDICQHLAFHLEQVACSFRHPDIGRVGLLSPVLSVGAVEEAPLDSHPLPPAPEPVKDHEEEEDGHGRYQPCVDRSLF